MKAIISFLTFILEGIARVVVFLLSTLGLWIPALFSLLFLIVCAVTQTPFTEVAGIFYVGFTLTLLLSIAITVALVLKKREKKRMEKNGIAPKSLKKKKKKNTQKDDDDDSDEFPTVNKVEPYAQPQPYPYQQGYPQQTYPYPQGAPQQPYPYQQGYAQPPYPYQQGYPQQTYPYPQGAPRPNQPQPYPVNRDYYNGQPSPNQSGYIAPQNMTGSSMSSAPGYSDPSGGNGSEGSMYEQAKRSLRAEFSGYNSPSPVKENVYGDVPKNGGFDEEKPLGVFRTRSDPRVLIYEYADRYEYWRRTDDGRMEFVRSETKRT